MKSSQDIISIIKNKPYFKKLKTLDRLDRLKLFLPLEMRKALLYITCKNNQLLFAFSHPSYANEFNHYNHTLIKQSLKTYADLFPQIDHEIQIRAFVPRNILAHFNDSNRPIDDSSYTEHAKGEFKNLAKTDSLKHRFESIRAIIIKTLQEQ
ncbi:hypothetical protein BKH46_01615 [Helicobacter sp. 12S02634-8]|uniref:hypothetical protein n=1 Tax=Helicobacter sp. 12S02634-8 TaxID=1476199 RepID=UPI000BA6BE04|nr:hypothetical protein [Helicobacter sp. 12S02634-8]PAF48034.1 hypothetical protein BKH46_01615 [Helicobacter sp. 12S02634-8]